MFLRKGREYSEPLSKLRNYHTAAPYKQIREKINLSIFKE